MFLRILRVLFIVGGLALMGVGAFMIVTLDSSSGSGLGAVWQCEPRVAGEPETECRISSGYVTDGPNVGGLGKYYLMPITGLGLIGAAIALGQFDRPKATAAQPARPAAAAGPPPVPPGQQPRWTGQAPGPPQH